MLKAAAQDSSRQFKIYSTKTKSLISLDELIRTTSTGQVILFGEEHNDSVGHAVQASLFKGLYAKYGNKVALSMEMFERDVQLILNEYLAGLITEKNFKTDARSWKNYTDYKPLIEFAKENKLLVLAANAPSRYVNRVSRLGLSSLNDLSEQAKQWLPTLPIDTLQGAYYDKFLKTMGSHSMPGVQIYQSQNLWDASMVETIVSFLKKNSDYKVLNLNGRFHSDEFLGTCYRLKKAGLKVATISCFAYDLFDTPDFSKLQNLADYVILTDPKVKRTF
ncbi:ChaN family lipoprotein [Solitalea lacus]|uniref:ChaN family lipoprotein n=1 Tax=Solitalea lacus TaxID=2911172 RepID=UPI001EDB3942|nr:ChaN family lipoprotein [Solitalea lacus]UKJ06623.1 ChaN family lipoprotein [Solitalea lacus]